MQQRCKLQVRRETSVDQSWGSLEVRIKGQPVFNLDEPGELRAVFYEAERLEISIAQNGNVILSEQVTLPDDHILLLSLNTARLKWRHRMLDHRAALSLTEISREYLAPYDPGPVEMLTQQFWVGTAIDERALWNLMAERDDYYSDENYEAQGTPEHRALSAFAEAMQEERYDHDFLEHGFAEPGDDLETRFAGHSWVEHWAPILRAKVLEEVLSTMNVFVMMGVEHTEKFGTHHQITSPRDVNVAGVQLRYIGEIVHPSHFEAQRPHVPTPPERS